MKERPILFSGPMVRAILEGRKTMTRRVIKQFPTEGYRWGGWIVESSSRKDAGKATVVPDSNWKYCATGQIKARCPYGQPGDPLWVRETFAEVLDPDIPKNRPRGPQGRSGIPARPEWKSYVVYRADGEMPAVQWRYEGDSFPVHWTPSLHMPRWASRLTLEIVSVRVERLWDMPVEDARSEGMIGTRTMGDFRILWDSINAARGYGWDANPWVWVVEFRRLP